MKAELSRSSTIDALIGRRLTLAMTEAHITSQQLARAIGAENADIVAYCRGKKRVPAALLLLIVQEVNKPVAWFYSDINEQPISLRTPSP
jgi:transcriptional regulator with XRE-family HTH domain